MPGSPAFLAEPKLVVEQNSKFGGVPTQADAFAYPFTHNQTQTHTHTHTKTRTKATAVRIKPQLMFTFLTTAKEKFALPAENSTLPAKPRPLH